MLDGALGQAQQRVDHLGRDRGRAVGVTGGDLLHQPRVEFGCLVGHGEGLADVAAPVATEVVLLAAVVVVGVVVLTVGVLVAEVVLLLAALAVVVVLVVVVAVAVGVGLGVAVGAAEVGGLTTLGFLGVLVLVLGVVTLVVLVVAVLGGADDHRLQEPVVGLVDSGRGVGVQGVQRRDPQAVGAGEVGVDVGDQRRGLAVETGGVLRAGLLADGEHLEQALAGAVARVGVDGVGIGDVAVGAEQVVLTGLAAALG